MQEQPPEQGSWAYRPEQSASGEAAAPQSSSVQWTASEFVSHQKSPGWYLIFSAAAAVFAVLVFLVTRDIALVVVLAAIVAVMIFYAARSPRTLQYSLDSQGIRIASRMYTYDLFKSFSVQDEGALSSIVLMPLQRLMPPISMYFALEDEEEIIEVLGSHLPLENKKPDFIDSLMRRIRF